MNKIVSRQRKTLASLREKRPGERRGVTTVLIGCLIVVVIGIVAFTVDIAHVMVAQAQMQRTADACALAATWEFANQIVEGSDQESATAAVRRVAQQYSELNPIGKHAAELGLNSTNSQEGDILLGHVSDFSVENPVVDTSSDLAPNAVRIRVLRTDNRNGRVPYYFARIFGLQGQELQASSMAGFARNIKGFQLARDDNNLPILPLILDVESWETLESGSGRDDWSWNEQTQSVEPGPDGIPETNIFPQKVKSKSKTLQRGTVNIGGSGHDGVRIANQILQGISAGDLSYHGGYLVLGSDQNLTMKGNKGLGGAKRELQQIIGRRRIIPIFSELTGDGPPLLGLVGKEGEYSIVKWVGVRVMAVSLKGKQKQAIVQRAGIVAHGMIPSETPDTSDGLYSTGFLLQ